MAVNPQLAQDMWAFEDVVKRATSNLFNPRPDAANSDGVPAVAQAKLERFEKKRIALLYFIEGLLEEKQGALQYAFELSEDALPPKPKAPSRSFDVVGEQPPYVPYVPKEGE